MPITEEVIELSVEETNKLRAELGLAPLRLNNSNSDHHQNNPANSPPASPSHDNNSQNQDEEVLELSVDDTNKLRAKLGLPPLRTGSATTSKIQDAGLVEQQRKEEQAKLQEQKSLKEDVERGIQTTFTAQPLSATADSDATAWAAKLRSQQDDTATKQKKTKKPKQGTLKYDENDLKGLTVSHAMSELEAGSTTVMTLADAPLLETNEHNRHIVKGLASVEHALENVNLAEQAKQADGLRKKRQLEMGMGRAGGYAGFDDDEFVELGGTGVPSRTARRGLLSGNTGSGDDDDDDDPNKKKLKKGFRIGQDYDSAANKDNQSDLFAMERGQAISLDPSHADVQASDFMTEEEALEMDNSNKKEKKKSKKKDKFEKKLKKKQKKEKKKHRRRQLDDDDDEDKEESEDETTNGKSGKKTLLEELEETAEDTTSSGLKKSRKRHRSDDDDDDNDGGDVTMKDESQAFTTVEAAEATTSKLADKKSDAKENKRAKYNAIMDKGNERTQQAFGKKQRSKNDDDNGLEEEPDDAFLNAALAKARRLKKLRDMSAATGADAVAESVRSMPDTATSSFAVVNGGTSGGITFSVDDTREFTRALQARSEQQSRKQSKALAAAKKEAPSNIITTVTNTKIKQEPNVETVNDEGDEGEAKNDNDGDVDMAELAKEIKDDDGDANNNGAFLDGTTGSTVSVGRGLAGVLNLLKQTGDLTRKNAGKEELRGRAKDVRNYEDYEAVDLKSVVKINERYATDKDREFASREVKLEYRDKHGRLLTKKAAFRDLCYQFHGHGSGKRKEEKRKKQMEREQAEKRFASQLVGADGGPGTLGALKATQKATGKAFIVHKT